MELAGKGSSPCRSGGDRHGQPELRRTGGIPEAPPSGKISESQGPAAGKAEKGQSGPEDLRLQHHHADAQAEHRQGGTGLLRGIRSQDFPAVPASGQGRPGRLPDLSGDPGTADPAGPDSQYGHAGLADPPADELPDQQTADPAVPERGFPLSCPGQG